MTTINPAVKAKWVAALRSGDYQQTTGQLRDDDNAFCCLGVLCNIHAQDHPEFAAKQRAPGMYDAQLCFLGKTVQKWAQAREYVPIDLTNRDGVAISLVGLNDSGEFTFNQIADVIEHFC